MKIYNCFIALLLCKYNVNDTLKIIIKPPMIVYNEGVLSYQIKSSAIDIGGI